MDDLENQMDDLENQMDDLTKKFKDVVLALKNTERCQDPEYQKLWQTKARDVEDRVEKLSFKDFKEFEAKFNEWINNEDSDFIRSAH